MSASARTGVPASSARRARSSVVLPAGQVQSYAVAVDLDLAEHADCQHTPTLGVPCCRVTASLWPVRTTVSPPSAP